MNRAQLIRAVEGYHCPNSTDAGGAPAAHYVKDGACVICDRTPNALAELHGIAA